MSDFTTFREGSLHAALKARYAATLIGGRVEAAVDGYVVDVAGEEELVEIQTASFASARRKLERLVDTHRVVLVYPIPIEKWLVSVDADGVVLRRRRSPKRGLTLDLFDELVHLPGLIGHPNFRLELSLVCEEEIRGPIPEGARYRYPRTWWRLDRRLLDVLETRRIVTPADLLGLLPAGLPEPFTTADIVAATGRSKRLAMRAVYCLERSGAIARLARRVDSWRTAACRQTRPRPRDAADRGVGADAGRPWRIGRTHSGGEYHGCNGCNERPTSRHVWVTQSVRRPAWPIQSRSTRHPTSSSSGHRAPARPRSGSSTTVTRSGSMRS